MATEGLALFKDVFIIAELFCAVFLYHEPVFYWF